MSQKIRILKRLKKQYPEFSQKQIKKWLADGLVLLGGPAGWKADLHAWVTDDDAVTVDAACLTRELRANAEVNCRELSRTDDYIFFEKGAGVDAVAHTFADTTTAANWILSVAPECREASETPLEAGLLHRLDRETSGVMVAARTRAAWICARQQFSAGEVTKEYECVVMSVPPPPGTYEAQASPHPRSAKKIIVQGSEAATDGDATDPWYFKDEEVPLEEAGWRRIKMKILSSTKTSVGTVLRIQLITGYRHQIRVHLAFLDCPILGDTLYGGIAAPKLHLTAVSLKLKGVHGEWCEAKIEATQV